MSKYSKQTVNRIAALIRSNSYTTLEICSLSGISKQTYYRWFDENQDFRDIIIKAKAEYTEKLVCSAKRSLVKLLEGFYYEETRTVYANSKINDNEGAVEQRITEKAIYRKYCKPSFAAISFVLCNADPDHWRNIFQVEVNSPKSKKSKAGILPINQALGISVRFSKMSDKEIDDLIKNKIKKSNE
jgi:hypothetical protein